MLAGSSYSLHTSKRAGPQDVSRANAGSSSRREPDPRHLSASKKEQTTVSPEGPYPPYICYFCEPFCIFVDQPTCQLAPMTAYIQAMVKVPPGPCSLARIDTVFKITDPEGNPIPVRPTRVPFKMEFEIRMAGSCTHVAQKNRSPPHD